MKNFIVKNNLYLTTLIGVTVAVFTALNWSTMPVLQRMVGLFFVGLILHLWEEGRFPGGFAEMFTQKLNFTQINPHFGEIITAIYVFSITLVPLFFPKVAFLALAPMMLGIVEPVMHLAAIRMFNLKRFYSPGLVTAWVVLLPIAIYTMTYAAQHSLMRPLDWVLSFLYMLAGLLLAQQIVIRASGMKPSDLMKAVQGTARQAQ